MNQRILTIALAVVSVFAALALVPRIGAIRLPGNHQAFEPIQPIAYSHRLHAGELAIPCVYCHSGAERSRYAGIPAASTCMNCHKFITAPRALVRAEEDLAKKEKRQPKRVVSPELGKLYASLALDPLTMKRDSAKPMQPIAWARIHRVPDFVYFDHRAHVNAGVACQSCHGQIETMERVRQTETLSMGWCIDCHRGTSGAFAGDKPAKAPTDCVTCHY